MAEKEKARKLIVENRKARHNYFVVETYERDTEFVKTTTKKIKRSYKK